MNLGNKKILHVSAWADALWHFRLPLMERLQKHFGRSVVYCPDNRFCGVKWRDSNDTHVEKLRSKGFEIQKGEICSSPKLGIIPEIRDLYKYLVKEQFDVVMTHQPMGSLIGITAAKIARVPFKIYTTGGLRHVPDQKGLANKLYWQVEAALIRMADAVFLVNKEDEQFLSSKKFARNKVYYAGPSAGCGICTEVYNSRMRMENRINSRNRFGIATHEKVIGYVGRCVWEKGFRELIDAAVILRNSGLSDNLRFAILGIGREFEEIKSYAAKKGVEDLFTFYGYKFDIDFCMASFDFFVLPSYREGMPVALLQAMALGVPSIATEIRGCREAIKHEITGILVPPKNSEKLAKAIERCIKMPREAAWYGERAEVHIKQHYAKELTLNRAVEFIDQMINGNNYVHSFSMSRRP